MQRDGLERSPVALKLARPQTSHFLAFAPKGRLARFTDRSTVIQTTIPV